MPAGPLLALRALRDPDGLGVGSGAGGRKGAAEPAAVCVGLGSASCAGWRRRDRAAKEPGFPLIMRGESAEPVLPGKKLLLAPSFRFFGGGGVHSGGGLQLHVPLPLNLQQCQF